jgi:rubrerythrin
MPSFAEFSGLKLDRPLEKEELIRALRFLASAEVEAVELYSKISEATTDEKVKKVIESVTAEEKVHVGEFIEALFYLDPEEKKFYSKGMEEAEETMGKKTLANHVRAMAKKVHDGKYEWDPIDDTKQKTMKYVSPYTGKKFHVSPSA